ncbi:hypothetical protein FB451DRAFT_1483032 [Mycena latifolia]|nr:hypothetical protein FB451DRAFT_1483032 [Mycena latifolia]
MSIYSSGDALSKVHVRGVLRTRSLDIISIQAQIHSHRKVLSVILRKDRSSQIFGLPSRVHEEMSGFSLPRVNINKCACTMWDSEGWQGVRSHLRTVTISIGSSLDKLCALQSAPPEKLKLIYCKNDHLPPSHQSAVIAVNATDPSSAIHDSASPVLRATPSTSTTRRGQPKLRTASGCAPDPRHSYIYATRPNPRQRMRRHFQAPPPAAIDERDSSARRVQATILIAPLLCERDAQASSMRAVLDKTGLRVSPPYPRARAVRAIRRPLHTTSASASPHRACTNPRASLVLTYCVLMRRKRPYVSGAGLLRGVRTVCTWRATPRAHRQARGLSLFALPDTRCRPPAAPRTPAARGPHPVPATRARAATCLGTNAHSKRYRRCTGTWRSWTRGRASRDETERERKGGEEALSLEGLGVQLELEIGESRGAAALSPFADAAFAAAGAGRVRSSPGATGACVGVKKGLAWDCEWIRG